MESLSAKRVDDCGHPGGVRHRRVWIRSARRLRWIGARLSMHVIQTFSALVERLECLVRDGPGRRYAVDMFRRLKVLAAQPVEDTSPELGVSPDAVVRVRQERVAPAVEPALGSPVPEMLPDRLRVPVLVLAWHHVSTFQHEN